MNLRSASATALLGSMLLLVVAALGWVLLLGPATARVSEQREAAEAAADRSALLATQLARLEARAQDLGETEKADKRLATLFPPTADQPGFFEQLGEIAREAGYAPGDVTTLNPTAPTPLAPPPAQEGVPPADTPADTPADASADAAAEGSEEGAAAPPAAPAGLAVQTVTMTLTGDYDQARRLLRGLEQLDRAFLVRSVSVSGEAGSSSLTLSISGATFVAPPVPAPSIDEMSLAG